MTTQAEKDASREVLANTIARLMATSDEKKQEDARMAALVQTVSSNAALLQTILTKLNAQTVAAPKKAPRTPGGAAAGGAAAAPGPSIPVNILLFFKKAFVEKIDGINDTFSAPMYADRIKADMDGCALPPGEGRDKKYAALLWSKLSQPEKESVRPSFTAFVEAAKRSAAPAPLDEAAAPALTADLDEIVPVDDFA